MTVTSILSWKYSPCALSKRVSFINCLPSSRTSYVSDSTDVKWLSTSWDTNQIKRKLTSFYGPVHSFVPGNQCLGTGTKWCCVHTLSTRYVTVYIVNSTQTPFLRRKLSSEYKAVDCLKSNKNSVHTSSRCSLCALVQGLNLRHRHRARILAYFKKGCVHISALQQGTRCECCLSNIYSEWAQNALVCSLIT